MNKKLSYQQSRLLELVRGAGREGINYLLAPVEIDDATVCCQQGLLVVKDGVAELTDDGQRYIVELDSSV